LRHDNVAILEKLANVALDIAYACDIETNANLGFTHGRDNPFREDNAKICE